MNQYGMNPRFPVNSNGALSPPPSTKNTMSSPRPTAALPSSSSETSSPSPGSDYRQMALYHSGPQVASPSPIMRTPLSPYRVPSSQSTECQASEVDPQQWQEFVAWKMLQQQQQQGQMQQQQQSQQLPPNMMSRNPQFAHQGLPRDSGYSSGAYESIGQMHGLPGQQPQGYTVKPGHTYKTVIATGNARVVRGNVIDTSRGLNSLERQHLYGKGHFSDKARIFDGNITTEDFKGFWNQN